MAAVARMKLKKLKLGIQFEMEASGDVGINANDPALKAMKESAKRTPKALRAARDRQS